MTKEATLDELLAKQPAIAEAHIVVDSELAEKWRAALAKVDKLRFSNNKDALPMENVASGLSLTFRCRPERDLERIPGWSPGVAGGVPMYEWRFRTARTRAGGPCA
jgi:hypothetical protein